MNIQTPPDVKKWVAKMKRYKLCPSCKKKIVHRTFNIEGWPGHVPGFFVRVYHRQTYEMGFAILDSEEACYIHMPGEVG